MPNPVDVWIIPLDAALPETLVLSADEWQRAQRLFPVPRHTFLASHDALRRILSAYLNIEPQQLEFQSDAYHKPSIRGDSPLCFNLTHSESVALCAVTEGRPIGVDVERVHPIAEMDAIASTHFAQAEYRQFSRLPSQDKEAAFFALWTRKEAFVKAVGQGLLYPLNRFRVPLYPTRIDQRLAILENEHGTALDWSLFSFCPAPRYMAACVVEGEAEPPTLYQFPAQLSVKVD